MTRPVRLSKSRFTAGLQCHRALWWRVHEPKAPELETGPELQAIFDQGSRVGELAREYVPRGVLVDLPYWQPDERVERTREAIAGGARVVYEASFRADDVFVSVDILHRAPGARGWTLTEVKSTTKVKPEHLPDAAVQTHVARRVGLPIVRTEVMHLNRECRHPDLSNLFTRADVTGEVGAYLPEVPGEVRAQLAMLRRPSPPEVEPGEHCIKPYECPFLARCWGETGEEPASREGEAFVDPAVGEVLAQLEAPVAHLDFETINPAVPVWPGCRPYDMVPVQFSVDFEQGGHFEHLASGAAERMPPLARARRRARAACARASPPRRLPRGPRDILAGAGGDGESGGV